MTRPITAPGLEPSLATVAAGFADAVCNALITSGLKDMALALQSDRERPVGTLALDIDFYSKAEADKPISDGSMEWQGQTVSWTGARWCVVKDRWTGTNWRRVRKLSGPLQFTDALTRCGEESRRTGIGRKSAA